MFSIHSVNSERELAFHDYRGDCFMVDLRGGDCSASLRIWDSPSDVRLKDFFHELAESRQPWQGERNWQSQELEMKLSATCSKLGQVTFMISLRASLGSEEEWQVKAGFITELGQLERIACEADEFFPK